MTSNSAFQVPTDNNSNLLVITDPAWKRVKNILDEHTTASDANRCGLRLSLSTRGCNGKSYRLDYVMEPKPMDEKISSPMGTIYIDPMAVMFLIGTEMDWAVSDFGSGFTFNNPNAKSLCGCGESFSV